MKSDGLTPYPVLLQILRPLLWPCANKEQVLYALSVPCYCNHYINHIFVSLKLVPWIASIRAPGSWESEVARSGL